MKDSFFHPLKPEEKELECKRAELALLEIQLAERELELTTLRVQLSSFERRYVHTVGRCYAEPDQLQAEIAELSVGLHPGDPAVRVHASACRAKAEETARTVGSVEETVRKSSFEPSDSLKRLYREAAKAIHPDLAPDDADRARREKVMTEVNKAYEEGDEHRLRAILHAWETSPDSVRGEGVAAELVRIIRRI